MEEGRKETSHPHSGVSKRTLRRSKTLSRSSRSESGMVVSLNLRAASMYHSRPPDRSRPHLPSQDKEEGKGRRVQEAP